MTHLHELEVCVLETSSEIMSHFGWKLGNEENMCMSRRVHPQVCLEESMIPPPFANSVKAKSVHPFQG